MLAQAEGVDSQKKPSKATGKRNKAGKKAEEDAETKHRMDGGKKPVEEGKEANGEKDREGKEEEKQSRKKKETEKQGDEVKKVDSTDEKLKSPLTQEGTTPGVVGFRNRQDLESSPTDWNDTTLTEHATDHGATTMNPFMDIVETFGEVGVGDGLRDFELPSPEGPHNTVGFALDWLMGLGPSFKLQRPRDNLLAARFLISTSADYFSILQARSS
ncbi:hypothetical protein HPB51_018697 [Rhipicephalus microplus]|uniref:Uncharacterized protein n=1 Tax=Rhipicephalus microplus TaxID=6941 RepID=A0A9J6DIV2_RHIMP|nr:hypothetical protein HPB51_018697 [Rhipicephalus microplus]